MEKGISWNQHVTCRIRIDSKFIDWDRDNETIRTASIPSFHSVPASLVEFRLIGSLNDSKNVCPAGWVNRHSSSE